MRDGLGKGRGEVCSLNKDGAKRRWNSLVKTVSFVLLRDFVGAADLVALPQTLSTPCTETRCCTFTAMTGAVVPKFSQASSSSL